jgi:multiple sugar transport system substrate-binding protein
MCINSEIARKHGSHWSSQVTEALGGAAATGGIAAILVTGRAPVYAQQTTVHCLRWNDFVPASDQLLRKESLPEAEKALGIKIKFETVNGNGLQPRVTSSVQSERSRPHHGV